MGRDPTGSWGLARKNLRRQPRRTRLLLTAVGGGLAVVLWILNFRNDGTRQMVGQFLEFNQGHAQVMRADFLQGPNSRPDPSATFAAPSTLGAGWAPRAWVPLLLAGPGQAKSVAVQGLDLAVETRLSGLGKLAPDWASLPRGHVVLGKQLARELGVEAGQKLAAIGQALDGSMIQEELTVWRLSDLGGGEFEASFAFMGLEDARSLMSFPDGHVHAMVSYRPGALPALPSQLVARPWAELAPDLHAAAAFSETITKTSIFFFMLVVALATANTLGLAFRERQGEFRALRVLGAARGWVWRLLTMETAWVVLLGMAWGNLVALTALTVCHFVPVDLAFFTGGGPVYMGGFLVDQHVRTTPDPGVFLTLNLALPVLVLGMAAWPVRKLVRGLDS